MQRLYRKLLITGTLECKTGLHIGDSKDTIEIGGIDNPIVKLADGKPYIPGSSLKGKMRCLLQQALGVDGFDAPKHDANSKNDKHQRRICNLFGGAGEYGKPSRLIVRDAEMEEKSAERLEKSPYTDMPYVEVKFENTIDRITGTAKHPRQQERVPAGTLFNVEFVLNVFGDEEKEDADANEAELLETFNKAVELLEEDYLGGSGSRGYGKVKLNLGEPTKILYHTLFEQA